jgi:hypothetical protein
MNYLVENNIDFYAELHKSNDEDYNLDISNNICMLSHLPLTDNFITLHCNHAFNYIPLYNEVCTKYIYNNYNNEKLNDKQIKCPYCRKIFDMLLPYIPYDCVNKEIGVNWPEKYSMKHMECKWINKCGKHKGEVCNKNAYKKDLEVYCRSHWTLIDKKKEMKDVTDIINVWTDEMEKLYKSNHIIGLKKILKEINLSVSGTKKVLVARIINSNK